MRWILALIGLTVIVVLVVVMQSDDADEATPSDGGPGSPPISADVTWPDDLDDEARGLLKPILDDLEGAEDQAADALARLAAADLTEALAPRARSVLVLLHPVLEDILHVSSDRLRRGAVGVLRAWVARVPEDADSGAAVPLAALATAYAASEENALRREIVIFLGGLPGMEAFRQLQRCLPDPSPKIRREAVRALAGRDDIRASAVLLGRLKEESDAGVRAEILRTWIRNPALRVDGLAARVRPLVDTPKVAVRIAAIELVGVLGDRESLPAIEKALATDDHDVRLASLLALGRLAGPESLRILEAFTDPGEEDAEVSRQLAWALGRCRK